MKQVFLLYLAIVLGTNLVQAQQTEQPVDFADSIRLVFEKSNNVAASSTGAEFANLWRGMGSDHQQLIKQTALIMKKKGYKLRPHFQNYFGSIVNSISLEGIKPERLTNYLTVARDVIQYEEITKVNWFLINSQLFFAKHALHADRTFRLYAKDDEYKFVYDAPIILSYDDTTSQDDNWENETYDDTQDNWDDIENDTTPPPPPIPFWLIPLPPPALAGPLIVFDKVTLNFATPFDSAFLKNTKGSFSLFEKKFSGEGGTFDWSSAGLSADSVYYELKGYGFDATKPALKSEQGQLTYRGKIPNKVDGIFEFKSMRRRDSVSSSYPAFVSYLSNIQLLGLSENISYTGGFALSGNRIHSSSVFGEPSFLEVDGEHEKMFTARSKKFEFKDSLITSPGAELEIMMGNDSIYHPSVQLWYDFGKQKLSLAKEKGYFKNAPFSSSYFKVDFSTDVLRWDLKSDSLNLFTSGGRSMDPMVIESVDFYHPDDYRLLAGKGFTFHALGMLVSYALTNGVREFYADNVADYYGKPVSEVHMAMTFLGEKGMIEYNVTKRTVKVKDKAFHVYDSRKGAVDYDNLKIHSIVDGAANATINFPQRYMQVRGVEEFNLSDSLNVIITPDSSVIKILQNRDIKFNGKIVAGNFEINGKDFTIKYDSFFVNLNRIDSIRFYVTEVNARGQTVRRRLNNAMVGADSVAAAAGGLDGTTKSSGTLFISRPDNKSGKLKIPTYPRLDATAGGVIYFDRREVLGGAYDRSVFFVVPPFKLDSLNDADPGAISFEGTFVSSGMFPSFKGALHTMPDKSLGFTHAIPKTGYPLYQGDGKIVGAMSLDNAGIRATGRIDYLAASVESQDFVFYPDSVVGKGSVGELKEKQYGTIIYPQVTLPEFKLNWKPKQDRFVLNNISDPFNFYNSTAQFNGEIIVSKKGVSGRGDLNTRGSISKSNDYNFSAKDFSARHASFEVQTDNPEKPALAGEDVRLKFNLDQNIAIISPEIAGVAAIEFPYAQFKTSIPEARWDLSTQKIVMSKDPNVPIEDSYFYTTRKELDSLNFNAEKAEYDIKSQQLKVSGVPYIIVADAKITPENNEILILENAKIGRLTNTTIVIDTLMSYHLLTEGVVDIISRKEFSGNATYQYVNSINDTFAIKLTNFHLEDIPVNPKKKRQSYEATQETVAEGSVKVSDSMVLAPRIYYKGDMVMFATRPALQLRGYTKLDLKKIGGYNTWLRYDQSGDETDFFLDFDNALTEEGRKPDAGLYFAADNSLYITFVSDKKDLNDESFFLPGGSLFFNKETGEFIIEDQLKATGEKLTGKVFAYNEEKQEVRFEGKVNFFEGSKSFQLVAAALGSGSLETNEIKMNSFIMMDANLPPQAFQIMAADILEVIKNEGVAEEALGDQTELLYKIADLVGERTVQDYEQRSLQAYVPLASIPQLALPLAFSTVNLKRSQSLKSFYSDGLLGLSHIGRNDINVAYEGFLEIRKNEDGGPVFNLFFKASPDSWYYFGFEDNRMLVHSSNTAFNATIAKKTNAGKSKLGELVFIPGSDEETMDFIHRFRKNYYNIETPYELGGQSGPNKKKKAADDGF